MPANSSKSAISLNLTFCLLAVAWMPSFAYSQAGAKAQTVRLDGNGDPLPTGAIARLGTLRFRFFDGRSPAIACSLDGRRAACGGFDSIRIFEVPSGKIARVVPNLNDPDKAQSPWKRDRFKIDSLGYRNDEQLRALATNGKLAILYEPESGKVLKKFPFDRDPKAISSDDRFLASGDGSGFELEVFDLKNDKPVCKVGSRDRVTFHAAFSPDSKHLATFECDQQSNLVRFWDIASGKELGNIALKGGSAYEMVYSPDGKRLIANLGSHISLADDFEPDVKEFQLVEFDVETGKEIRKLGPKGMYLSCLSISKDGNVLAGLIGSTVRFFDLQAARLSEPPSGHEDSIKALAFTPDGGTLVSAGDNSIRFWDPSTARQRQVKRLKDGIGSIALSEKADVAAFENKPGSVYVWYLPGDRLLRTIAAPTGRHFWSVDLNVYGDADILAVLGKSVGDTCRFWNIHSGVEQMKWKLSKPVMEESRLFKYAKEISAAAIDKKAGRVALASADTVVLLDFVSGKELWREKTDDRDYTSRLNFSPDGHTLVSGDSHEGRIRQWDLESGKRRNWLVIPPGQKYSAVCPPFAIAPNGKVIATGGQDGAVRLWDLATAKEDRCFLGHEDSITFLKFAPDGKTLASGSEDTTILIWNLEAPSK